MNSPANLRVRISADLADIKQGLGLLRGELAKVKQQAAAAMPNLGSNAAVAGVRRLRAEVVGLVATYASLRGVGILSTIADEATQLRGRVRAAKGDYEALLALSQETRSSIAGTVDLYARMERATRNQGVSQERLLRITKAVNQAVKLSYADAGTANAAITQFAQGLAAGVLRGQDLNSVIAGTPVLAEAIAKGMGRQIGEIKKLGEQGKLTTKEVLAALENQASALEKEFSQVPVTIGDALTQIRNSFVDYVGDVDSATGASKRFAQTLQQVAKDLPRYLDPLLQAIMTLLQNLDVLAVFMITRFVGAAIPAVIVGVRRLVVALRAASTAALTLRAVLLSLGGPVGIAIAGLAAGIYYLYKRTTEAKRAAEEHRKAMDETRAMARQSAAAAYEDAKAKRAQAIATLQAALAAAHERQQRLDAARDVQSKQSGRGAYLAGGVTAAAGTALVDADQRVQQAARHVDELNQLVEEMRRKSLVEAALQDEGTPSASTVATEAGKKVAASNALMRDAVQRALTELDRLYKEHEIGASEYYASRLHLQQQAIDLQIEQARHELAATKDAGKRRDIEEQIVILQRDRADLAVSSAREEKKAIEELDKIVGDVYVQRLEDEGKLARAVSARLEEEFRERIVRLQAEGRDADVRTIRLHIDAEVAKAQLSEFDNQMTQVLANLQAKEQTLSAQQQAGLLGIVESERQIKEARTGALQQLAELRQKAVEFLATLSEDSPEAAKVLAFIQRLDGDIAGVASSIDRFRQQIADAAIDSVTNLFMDLVEGSKSAGEALRDFVRGFALAMAQIAAKAMATFLVLQLLDAIYPGLGKATAASMSAGVLHTGGIAGQGGVRRSLPAWMFGAAPRYHVGGIAGLGPDEVPAVLQRGEEVLTEDDPRHRSNGGAGADRVLVKTPIVAIGDRAVADALASAAGEQVVLTHVRNNWGSLSRGS